MDEVAKYKVQVMLNTDVISITKTKNVFQIVCRDERIFTSNKLIVATGGFNKASSYEFISKAGVGIVEPVPSLFSFKIQHSPFKDLPGSVISNAMVTITHTKQNMQGPMLITHEGMSGPAILKLSALAARELYECNYIFSIRINALPMLKQEHLRQKLNEMKLIHAQKKVGNTPLTELTSRLWIRYCELSNISPEDVWQSVSKNDINVLCEKLQNLVVDVNGKSLNKEEFVTCGGVDLKQINLQRMEHKNIPDLFFAGEVMNVDGVTGGFNFQHAWTSGYIAACWAAGGGE
jgi:predicted Rossmann fold flavoprotein